MTFRTLMSAFVIASALSGCTMWPRYEGGGMAEYRPVTEPDVPHHHRYKLEKYNSIVLHCLRSELYELKADGATLHHPADMRRAFRQWDRAAREHAGRMPFTAFKDMAKLDSYLLGLRAKLYGESKDDENEPYERRCI